MSKRYLAVSLLILMMSPAGADRHRLPNYNQGVVYYEIYRCNELVAVLSIDDQAYLAPAQLLKHPVVISTMVQLGARAKEAGTAWRVDQRVDCG